MNYKTVIVDDEFLGRKRVVELVSKYDQFLIEAECGNGDQAIEKINEISPDVLFLDIELKDMTGFDVLRKIKLKKMPLIVFITAYDQYAVQAFNDYAIDFLLKPFKNIRFHETIERVLERKKQQNYDIVMHNFIEDYKSNKYKLSASEHLKLPIRSNKKTVLVDVNKIIYICASSYYSEVYTEEKKFLIRESLRNLLTQIQSSTFIRIHRSTIINTEFIMELVHSDFNELDIRMKDQKLFRVSKTYKKDFLKLIGLKS